MALWVLAAEPHVRVQRGRGGAPLRLLCSVSPIVGSQDRPKRTPLGLGSPHSVCTLGFLSLYQPRIGEGGCESVGSTRTSSARGGTLAGGSPDESHSNAS